MMLLRIRQIKCDERKPRCERCTSTGRNCDGYDPLRALLFEVSRAKELPLFSGTHCIRAVRRHFYKVLERLDATGQLFPGSCSTLQTFFELQSGIQDGS